MGVSLSLESNFYGWEVYIGLAFVLVLVLYTPFLVYTNIWMQDAFSAFVDGLLILLSDVEPSIQQQPTAELEGSEQESETGMSFPSQHSA